MKFASEARLSQLFPLAIKSRFVSKLLSGNFMDIGLNIFYSVLSVHTFIHEHILVQALGLDI